MAEEPNDPKKEWCLSEKDEALLRKHQMMVQAVEIKPRQETRKPRLRVEGEGA
jgi:hypothetical protein